LVIGRFQPFHKGHAYLIEKSLEFAEKIVIGIGSSNISDHNNPLTYQQRKKLVDLFITHQHIQNKVLKVVPLPDIPDDDMWFRETRKTVGKFDVVIGNNDWVNGIFQRFEIPVIPVEHYQRFLYEGYKIRALMRNNIPWEERVPDYLINSLKKTAKTLRK